MNNESEIMACMSLNLLGALTEEQICALIVFFGSAATAWEVGPEEWGQALAAAIDPNPLKIKINAVRSSVDAEMKLVQDRNVKVLLRHQPPYPGILSQTRNPPLLIYYRGNWREKTGSPVAIVGSRRPTYYGEKVTGLLSRDLSTHGLVTISGLARGIDSVVHRETMRAGGVTWAVVGCGLNSCYPLENQELMEEIAARGLVISEFSMDTPPYPGNFPRRNRIIAGLAKAVVVVEGTSQSGSLITARIAALEGRDVYAVPGPVTSPLSEAPHILIQSGAKLIRSAQDILEDLPQEQKPEMESSVTQGSPNLHLPEIQKQIIKYAAGDPILRDELAVLLQRSPSDVASITMEMELQGLLKSVPGGRVVAV